jgi:hypothetical protein
MPLVACLSRSIHYLFDGLFRQGNETSQSAGASRICAADGAINSPSQTPFLAWQRSRESVARIFLAASRNTLA